MRLLAPNASVEHGKYVAKEKAEADPRELGWQRISPFYKPLEAPLVVPGPPGSSSSNKNRKVSLTLAAPNTPVIKVREASPRLLTPTEGNINGRYISPTKATNQRSASKSPRSNNSSSGSQSNHQKSNQQRHNHVYKNNSASSANIHSSPNVVRNLVSFSSPSQRPISAHKLKVETDAAMLSPSRSRADNLNSSPSKIPVASPKSSGNNDNASVEKVPDTIYRFGDDNFFAVQGVTEQVQKSSSKVDTFDITNKSFVNNGLSPSASFSSVTSNNRSYLLPTKASSAKIRDNAVEAQSVPAFAKQSSFRKDVVTLLTASGQSSADATSQRVMVLTNNDILTPFKENLPVSEIDSPVLSEEDLNININIINLNLSRNLDDVSGDASSGDSQDMPGITPIVL